MLLPKCVIADTITGTIHCDHKKITHSAEANLWTISQLTTRYISTTVLQIIDCLLYNDRHHTVSFDACDFTTTTLRSRSWPRLSRWKHRSVTFCETWWPQGLSAWWDADKCQSAGTWGRSPFSSDCRLSSARLQNSSLWAVLCSSGWPSWCCSQYSPGGEDIRTEWKIQQNNNQLNTCIKSISAVDYTHFCLDHSRLDSKTTQNEWDASEVCFKLWTSVRRKKNKIKWKYKHVLKDFTQA